MDRDNQTMKLKDGRTLGFSEHGDFNGKPVFYMHGNPNSRFNRYPDDSANNLGLRIITPDRPGMGLSDFKPHRKLLDLPDDIVQLADHLQINSFSIFGASAGGIYTLACAYKIPERLEKVVVISGAAPFDSLSDPYQGMSEKFKKSFVMISKSPLWLLRVVLWNMKRRIVKNAEAAYQETIDACDEFDKKIALEPALKAWYIQHLSEPYRQGTKGYAHEVKIVVSPWGFNAAEITTHVDLWYWEDDTTVPIQMGKYLASVIPKNTTHFFPGGGHYGAYAAWGEVLKSIAGK